MADAKKCDRCKMYYDKYNASTRPEYEVFYTDYRRDLCPKCSEELKVFMNVYKEHQDEKLS